MLKVKWKKSREIVQKLHRLNCEIPYRVYVLQLNSPRAPRAAAETRRAHAAGIRQQIHFVNVHFVFPDSIAKAIGCCRCLSLSQLQQATLVLGKQFTICAQ